MYLLVCLYRHDISANNASYGERRKRATYQWGGLCRRMEKRQKRREGNNEI